MARVCRTKNKNAALAVRIDNGRGSLELIRGGRRAYLWAHTERADGLLSISGEATLRRLAKAILAEVGE